MINERHEMESYLLTAQPLLDILCYPITHARVLMQLGHEPNPPALSHTFLSLIGIGQQQFRYPGILTYWKSMVKDIGLSGLFLNGLPARMIHLITLNQTENLLHIKYKRYIVPQYVKDPTMQEIFTELCIRWATKFGAIVIAYPFHVVMVHQVAQIIGKETVYGNIFQTIGKIYSDEGGIRGFYGGVSSYLVAQFFEITLLTMGTYTINKYVLHNRVDPELKQFTKPALSFVSHNVTYKFMVISTVMAVANANLQVANADYRSFLKCYQDLRTKDALYRGYSLFLRYISSI